jgi:hypothetical protein
MLLFLVHDSPNCARGLRISTIKHLQLLLEVCKNHPLDSHGSRGDCSPPKQTRDNAQRIPARATKEVAATTAHTTALQLEAKDLPVSLFVRSKLRELCHERWCSESREEELARIDVNRSVLTSVVHLEDASTQPVCGPNSSAQFHEA